jgi:pyruvate-formate lyase-activating enzyme
LLCAYCCAKASSSGAIQGFNASEADITAITDFAADRLQVSEIHFLPYHTF